MSGSATRLMGVDVLAIYPDGSHALVGNQLDVGTPTIVDYVTLVDLTTNAVSQVNTASNYPVAIDVNGNIGIPTMTEGGS